MVDLLPALAAMGHTLQARGWMPATSGNLSLRHPGGGAWMSPSGRDKGSLSAADFILVDDHGQPRHAEQRASAETLLHLAVYQRFPDANVILHVHSPSAVVLSRRLRSDIHLTDFELLKALDGITTHEAVVQIPVLPNDQDMQRLTPLVLEGLDRTQSRWAFVLAGHGVYAWGPTLAAAHRHLEALDNLFHCLWMELT